MQKKANLFVSILENFTLVMILFVLLQTFLEDFSVFMGFPINAINSIKLSAIIFDVFFTIEFFVRLFSAIYHRRGINYFFYRNGWIDLLASLPLLLLISGPEFLSQVLGIDIFNAGFMNALGLLKVIKAIRVARILRLLRVLKVFGKIKNVNSVMAQRHVSMVSTIVVSGIIVFLVSMSIFGELGVFPSRYIELEKKEKCINGSFKRLCQIEGENDKVAILETSAKDFDNIAEIVYNNRIIYKSDIFDSDIYKYYAEGSNDHIMKYKVLEEEPLIITYWRGEYFKEDAFYNLFNFGLIIFVLLLLIVIYTRHFALTVSDPIFVMRNGFEKRDYTFAVKIQKHYREDDVFILADDYNSRWLPAKIRKLHENKNKTSKLSFKDIFKDEQ